MPDLPSGTVTFLFTDIEGSAALWERDRTAMAAGVKRHITLRRSVMLCRLPPRLRHCQNGPQLA